jgi:nucleoside-diphosphate-sugar epimerase
MKAFVTDGSSLLAASLTGALQWEGHTLAPSALEADVVFDTSHGVVYRRDRALARFVFGELLGPGDVEGTAVGDWIRSYVRTGQLPDDPGGACLTDARDVALAMITAAERGVSGEFEVVGPFVTFEELRDMLTGSAQARTSVALPELGLTFRPAEETVLDVIKWQRTQSQSLVA